ncbi:hypothetical protein CSUB01_08020 [Colletotrichum sublineola]|uniref:Uncharacterized protein n=1 Tax=Colletotrichum sublineola TaxID=1173701 RepID=A0A066WX58_COLSU|nr:hypothetical protein CSUB01_08020 [Colletotrichum sublineola]
MGSLLHAHEQAVLSGANYVRYQFAGTLLVARNVCIMGWDKLTSELVWPTADPTSELVSAAPRQPMNRVTADSRKTEHIARTTQKASLLVRSEAGLTGPQTQAQIKRFHPPQASATLHLTSFTKAQTP